jgi:hypothetical protein
MTKRCPRQQSDTTPCVVVYGPICYTLGAYRRPMCAGCDAGPTTTGVGVDLEALTRQVDEYARTGLTRQFPIPTDEEIIRAQKTRRGRRG